MHTFELKLSDEQIDRFMAQELLILRDYSDTVAEKLACEILLEVYDSDRQVRGPAT